MTSYGVALRWVSTAELVDATIKLAGMLPPNITGVVGIPRSGMIPASLVAAHLYLPLLELTPEGPRSLSAGSRGWGLPKTHQRYAVIDDTIYSGSAVRRARAIMKGLPAIFAVAYARPAMTDQVDLFAEQLASPHLLEWNFANNGPFRGRAANPIYGAGIACDFDGIICHDARSGGRAGQPYLVPRMFACRLIATGRHERYRTVTERWLHDWGVKWDALRMLPDDLPGNTATIARHKAEHYAESNCGFFVESDPVQAELIYRLARKPVVCPKLRRVWPEEVYMAKRSTPPPLPTLPPLPTPAPPPVSLTPISCMCSGPGYCQQFQKEMTQAEYELCSCTCADERFCTPPVCERRRRRWQGQIGQLPVVAAGAEAMPIRPHKTSGPGTELKALLSSLGLATASGCGCNSRAKQMDGWGVEGCELHREEICSWLRQEQAKRGWLEKLKAAALAVTSGLAFTLTDLADPADSLLNEAIRRAKDKSRPSTS